MCGTNRKQARKLAEHIKPGDFALKPTLRLDMICDCGTLLSGLHRWNVQKCSCGAIYTLELGSPMIVTVRREDKLTAQRVKFTNSAWVTGMER